MKYQVKIRKVFNTDKPVKALASVTIEEKSLFTAFVL